MENDGRKGGELTSNYGRYWKIGGWIGVILGVCAYAVGGAIVYLPVTFVMPAPDWLYLGFSLVVLGAVAMMLEGMFLSSVRQQVQASERQRARIKQVLDEHGSEREDE